MYSKRPLFILFAFALYFAPSYSAFAEQTNPAVEEKPYLDIQRVTSDGGITAWLVEDHSLPIISIQYAFRHAGAKNDPIEKQGLARLASNTMDEGAGHLDSLTFQKMLRDHSISLSFSASRDHFYGKLKTLSENKSIAFDMLRTALTSPRFDDDAVDRMRKANQSRIQSSLSDPDWRAARIQNDVIFAGHPYAMNSGGSISSLDNITKNDLHAFHKSLGKNQLVVGVTGDITVDELADVLDDLFGHLPDVDVAESASLDMQNSGKTYLHEMDIPQTVIEISQKGVSRKDDNYYPAKVMNFILGESGFGSRLMDEIRESQGLTYGIYSYFREYSETPVFHISTSTKNENVRMMIDLIHLEIEKITSEPVTEEELASAKSYLIGSLPLSLTSTDSISSILLSLQIDDLPMDYLDTRASEINAVSAEHIKKAASDLFQPEALTTVFVGATEYLDNFEKVDTLPNVE